MISEESLSEFIRLFKKRYGTTLSREDALERATRLLTLLRPIVRRRLKDTQDKPLNAEHDNDNPDK